MRSAIVDSGTASKIKKLEYFKVNLYRWQGAADMDPGLSEYRTNVNQNKRAVRDLMIEADCHRKVPVRVLRPDGAYEEVYVDPLDVLFNPPDSHQVISWVIDMVDETIGVLQDRAAAYDSFMDDPGPASERPILDMRLQLGRLELVDPPADSPLKLNRLGDELPDKLTELTTALADLTEAVKQDNGFLGQLLKTQILAMLKATVAELEAPQADTSRLKATAKVLTDVAVEAGKRGGAEFIKSKLEVVASSLAELVKSLWQ
jgi:hypothetical protein